MRKAIVGKRRLQQLARKESKEVLQQRTHQTAAVHSIVNNEISKAENTATESEDLDHNCNNHVSAVACDYHEIGDSAAYTSSEDSESDSEQNLLLDLKDWAITSSVNHKQFSSLLKLLKNHACFKHFPSDSRTVLAIRKSPEVLKMNPGEYVHFGLDAVVESCIDSFTKELPLQINVDGLPLFKSSSQQLWPILGHFVSISSYPFIIGAYCGSKKPANVNEFLKFFVDDFNELKEKLKEKEINLYVHSFVCDAPAKAYIKCVKGHTGYFGCDKCNVEGSYVSNRITYTDLNALCRNNASFRDRRDNEHHLSDPILERIPSLDMVDNFPMDYMHLVCLGVMRKLLHIWLKGKPSEHKLSGQKINLLSQKLLTLSKETVYEFSRKPRGVNELERWKATEFRLLLLYTGVYVFKNILSRDSYKLFLVLSVAIRILSTEETYVRLNSYAESLLKYFVEGFQALYGIELVSYNVHGLIHLAPDSQKLGTLDQFSAFKFEKKLGKIKKLVRTPNKPLQQIINRLLELETTPNCKKLKSTESYSQCHEFGPLIDGFDGRQYQVLDLGNFRLRAFTDNGGSKTDSYCLTKTLDLFILRNICCSKTSNTLLLGSLLTKKRSLFLEPCDSELLNIYYFHNQPCVDLVQITLDDIKSINDEGGQTCEIVPESWFSSRKNECAWPPVKNVTKYVEKNKKPESHWRYYPARKLHAYDTYKAARANIHRAEVTSDLNSEPEKENTPKRRRRLTPRKLSYQQSSDESDIEDQDSSTRLKKMPAPPTTISGISELQSVHKNEMQHSFKAPFNSTPTPGTSRGGLDNIQRANIDTKKFMGPHIDQYTERTSHKLVLLTDEVSEGDNSHGFQVKEFVDKQFPLEIPQEDVSSQLHFPVSTNMHVNNTIEHEMPGTSPGTERTSYSTLQQTNGSVRNPRVSLDGTPGFQESPVTPTRNAFDDLALNTNESQASPEICVLLRRLVRDMSFVKQFLINLDHKVETLRGESWIRTASKQRLGINLPIPICTMEEFITFDILLSNEPKHKESLMQTFVTCGGDSVVEFIGRALRKIYSEELATKFSLRGQKGNSDFSATNTWNVLKDAALAQKNLNATEKMIEKAVSEWFRHSNERLHKKIKKTSAMQIPTSSPAHD